jgi:two-component system CheB/CheR fusion protein
MTSDDGHSAPPPPAPADPKLRLAPSHVVGLGASAGGLEALTAFLRAMDANTGFAFVVVTHQAANRTSLLPSLLAKQTPMSVHEVTDGMLLQANQVYIAPPARFVQVITGHLRLADTEPLPGQLPINFFFRSLAHDQKERAIGVVLSGTGSDGTLGLTEIKAQLGLSIVQAEDDAAFAGMPHSAMVGDSPDLVAPAAEIPSHIAEYAQRFELLRARPAGTTELSPEALRALLALLRQRTGHDFSWYKESTVRRRIERRMNLQRTETLQQYFKFLSANPSELDLLFEELLIGVTSFFRDPAAFESLAELLSHYLRSRPENQQLRVWVAGCSTGQEAYSVAIVVREALDALGRDQAAQVFATDLDPKAIDVARAGSYPLVIAGDITPARLKRFFTRTESGYQVRKELREMLVFATQNLIEDPPFTKLDLMCCRNLLIYLDAPCQRRLFPIFHYVLRPGGTLFLGSSETIGQYVNLFDSLDKKWRLYRRREVSGGTYLAEIPASVSLETGSTEGTPPALAPRRSEVGPSQLADRMLLRELVPPTVLIRERGEIVHIHGRTGMFLEPAPGQQINANIYNMAREGLHLELAAAVRQAAHDHNDLVRRNVQIKSNGHKVRVDLRVRRLQDPESLRGLFRISFENARAVDEQEPVGLAADPVPDTRVVDLERELLYTKESHQGTIEELETANEELKSTNEELQSTNEELQSANEELETSKEELQSLNEELQTVNLELHGKVEELSRANDDMTNLLNATDIATIFLDNDLNIKRHTEQARRVIRLIPTDVGRSIGDLVSRLSYDHLLEDAREVLRTLVFKEVEVHGKGDGKWYLMRILPYRTIDNVIDGLVVTFVDITRVKLLQESEQRLVRALQHAPVSVFGIGPELRFMWAGSALLGREPVNLLGHTFDEVFQGAFGPVREALANVLKSASHAREQLCITLFGRRQRVELFAEAQRIGGEATSATCVLVLVSEPCATDA